MTRSWKARRWSAFGAVVFGALMMASGCELLAPLPALNDGVRSSGGGTLPAGGARSAGDGGSLQVGGGTSTGTAGTRDSTIGGEAGAGAGAGSSGETGAGGTGGETDTGGGTGGESGRGDGTGGEAGFGGGTVEPPTRTTLATDWFNACAIFEGIVRCWGNGGDGALGDGVPRASGEVVAEPVTVVDITDATAVGTGRGFACALRAGGDVACWGDGQLRPKPVSDIEGAVDLAVGTSHACALLTGGRVKCWGGGSNGQLGDGVSYGNPPYGSETPVDVANLTTATRIFAGATRSCALLDGGTVSCWGGCELAQPNVPFAVSGLTEVTDVAVGQCHSCALRSDRSVWCWGRNDSGQVGTDDTSDRPPTLVGDADDSVQVVAGLLHSCALQRSGWALCWGSPTLGQLGHGRMTSSPLGRVETVSDVDDAVEIAAGYFRTCARLLGDRIVCWGEGSYGTLGDGLLQESSVPVEIQGAAP